MRGFHSVDEHNSPSPLLKVPGATPFASVDAASRHSNLKRTGCADDS
jgi:hypothetical protein